MSQAASLAPRSRIGAHTIQHLLGMLENAACYEVLYGSTGHACHLLVMSPPPHLDFEGFNALLKPLIATRHPCLAKPFACGADEGFWWIRSQLPRDIPASDFGLQLAEGHEDLALTNAAELCQYFANGIPQTQLWPLVADLVEALAALHDAGIVGGPFDLASVTFQRHPATRRISARLSDYGLEPLLRETPATKADPRSDVRSLARIIRQMLCGTVGTLPQAAWPEWKSFLSACEGETQTCADGKAMYFAFCELLDARRLSHEPLQPPADPAESAAEEADETKPTRQRRGRRHRPGKHTGLLHDREANYQPGMNHAFRVILMIALLCGIGFLAYWLLSRGDRLREDGWIGQSARLDTTAAENETAREQVKNYWTLNRAELEEFAEGEHPLAAMRLAFWIAQGDEEHAANPAAGILMAAAALERLQSLNPAEADSPDALYWQGYASLTGFGTDFDAVKGRAALQQAIEKFGDRRAMALLADYLIYGQTQPTIDDERQALNLWQRVTTGGNPRQAFEQNCVDKALELILAGRGLPTSNIEQIQKWLIAMARGRHIGAMLAVADLNRRGELFAQNDNEAFNWYRDASMQGNAVGMRERAMMYEQGIGTPQSDESAIRWYRRAARGGDAAAMEHFAALLAEGRVEKENDDDESAELWLTRAREARAAEEARPAPLRWWSIVGGRVSTVGTAPAPKPATPEADHLMPLN